MWLELNRRIVIINILFQFLDIIIIYIYIYIFFFFYNLLKWPVVFETRSISQGLKDPTQIDFYYALMN